MKSWEITKKDIRLLLRDARAVFVLLVLPMVFITIIGLTMGKLFGWQNTNQILKIGVVNSIAYDEIGGPAGTMTNPTPSRLHPPATRKPTIRLPKLPPLPSPAASPSSMLRKKSARRKSPTTSSSR